MTKLRKVLLVDDDEATNFLHKMIIKKTNYVEEVSAVMNGIEAIEYLKNAAEGKHAEPNIIFLDINMPGMNGWEFLEEYKKLYHNTPQQYVVIMLSTSLNPEDKKRAEEQNDIVHGYVNKPLTKEILEEIIKEHCAA